MRDMLDDRNLVYEWNNGYLYIFMLFLNCIL